MPRPILATVDLAALRHNLQKVRQRAPRARIMAVIKANAYGHGLLPCADALRSADGLAVLDLEDAVELREAGFHQPILLLEGVFAADDLILAGQFMLDVVVHNEAQLQWLETVRLTNRLTVWLKVDTGMHRLGLPPDLLSEALIRLSGCANIGKLILMSHFACADEADGVMRQWQCFRAATGQLGNPISLANSAAILAHPTTQGDWVRPGIMLYGATPFADQPAAQFDLRPVMTLQSRIIAVQDVLPGDSVGYGGLFRAERPTRVGIVACGYADGYPRHAPTGTPVLVGGQRTRTLGRVSMDMLAIDLSPTPNAGYDSPVELWGTELPVDEVAQAAGTVGYELLSALAERVPISYLD